jgi:hypothetical protein
MEGEEQSSQIGLIYYFSTEEIPRKEIDVVLAQAITLAESVLR